MNHYNFILKVKKCPQTEAGRNKDFQALSYILKDFQDFQRTFQIQGHLRAFKFCTNPGLARLV